MATVTKQTLGPPGPNAENPNRVELTVKEHREALTLIAGLFGIDTTADTDPLIDKPMIAKLAGVAEGTPGQWEQRTREQREKVPFPVPDDTRYPDKPQWRAISTVIACFLKPSNRWPQGVVARESTRVTERYTFAQLDGLDSDLAEEVRQLGGNDDRQRSLQGWRGWRTRLANEAAAATPEV